MKKFKNGDTQKVDVFFFVSVSEYDQGKITCFPYSTRSSGEVLISQCQIDVNLPMDFNLTSERLKILNMELEKISENYYAQKKQIEEKIQTLLCIENGASS